MELGEFRDFSKVHCSRFKLQVDSIEMSYCFVEWFFDDFESTHDVIFLKNETRTSTHPIDNLVSGKVVSSPHLSFTKIHKQLDWHTLLAHDGIYCLGFLWDGRISLCSSGIKMLEKL